MDINSILTNSETDVQQVREALLNVKSVLQNAAHDYANASLNAAQETLECVSNAAPCVAVWPHILEHNKYLEKANDALTATTQATALLLMVEETGDDYIDTINSDVKVDAIQSPVICAVMEGATLRMNIALQGVPQSGAPGMLCNPKALDPNPPPEDQDV